MRADPSDETMLIFEGRVTKWEGMAADGRQRTGYAVANALRKHMAEAETALYPAIPRERPGAKKKESPPPDGSGLS